MNWNLLLLRIEGTSDVQTEDDLSAWNREHLKKLIFDTNLDCDPNLIPSLLFYTVVWEGSKDWIARVSNSLVILGRDQLRSTAT